jgi:IclR helix-turn-helix domain
MVTAAPINIEQLFCRGAHIDIVKLAVDSPTASYELSDLSFVIGSLVFVGRSDDAFALYRQELRNGADTLTEQLRLAGCRFFLCIAECRAGRYGSAERLCRENIPFIPLARNAALGRFFFHQGMGLVHYFRGQIRHAMRHATRARSSALLAKFPYGRMLALDLLGHTNVQLGKAHVGLALLEQSAELATGFGFSTHARTTHAALLDYRLRLGMSDAAELDELFAGLSAEDSYSQRLLANNIAIALALRGDRKRADIALARSAEIAMTDGDHRSRIRLCLAHAIVAGLADGEPAAIRWIDEAIVTLHETDRALRVEAYLAECLVAPLRFALRSAEELTALATLTGMERARFLADNCSEMGAQEDTLLAAMRSVRGGIAGALPLLQSGIVALLPRATQRSPGKRIYLDPLHERVVLEDHGQFSVRTSPPQRTLALLTALRERAMNKEMLVETVWQIKKYAPARHDAVVHTTISRVRAFLEPWGDWLQSTHIGYALVDVDVVDLHVHPSIELQEPAIVEQQRADIEAEPAVTNVVLDKPSRRRVQLLQALAAAPQSTTALAAVLGVSEMTAFRALSDLVREGLINRTGTGKNTRYALVNTA